VHIEPPRRRNSECKVAEIFLAAMAVGLQRGGDWLAARRSDQCAAPGGLTSGFALPI